MKEPTNEYTLQLVDARGMVPRLMHKGDLYLVTKVTPALVSGTITRWDTQLKKVGKDKVIMDKHSK